MTTTIRDLMTTDVVCLDEEATAADAAEKMRQSAIGDVLVTRDGELCGIVTDRDLVIRCVADGQDPTKVRLRELCSDGLETLPPSADVDEAVTMMRERAIRRVPVVDGGKPVGIVSLGDLAIERDRRSVLGEISAAPPTS